MEFMAFMAGPFFLKHLNGRDKPSA